LLDSLLQERTWAGEVGGCTDFSPGAILFHKE